MIVLFDRRVYESKPRSLCNQMPKKDLISWNALIFCFEQNNMYKNALVMFITTQFPHFHLEEKMVFNVEGNGRHPVIEVYKKKGKGESRRA